MAQRYDSRYGLHIVDVGHSPLATINKFMLTYQDRLFFKEQVTEPDGKFEKLYHVHIMPEGTPWGEIKAAEQSSKPPNLEAIMYNKKGMEDTTFIWSGFNTMRFTNQELAMMGFPVTYE